MAKKDNKKMIISIIIIFLMVSSVAGFVASYGSTGGSQNSFRYNGQKFTFDGQVYLTEIEGEEVAFYYTPDVAATHDIPETFLGQSFSFTRDQNSSLEEAFAIVHFDLSQIQPIQGGYTTEGPLPTITCEREGAVLYMKQGTPSGAVLEDNCLTLTVQTSADAAFYRDAILYEHYNII